MKKYLFSILIIIISSFMLTGCVDVGNFELSEEQEAEVVEYSTSLLLKYNKNTSSRIVDTTAKRQLMARVEEYRATHQNDSKVKDTDTSSDENADSGSSTGGKASGSEAVGEQNIARALHQNDGISIDYANYEICKSYPRDGSADGFFALDATAGNDLMVFHFDIKNNSDSDVELNVLDIGPMFRFIFNGNDRKNALSTLLFNDLATYNTTLEAGGYEDAVVILEVPEGFDNSVSEASFLIKVADEQSIIPIN